jgi:arsenate reductase-like glutaredoxin family protein
LSEKNVDVQVRDLGRDPLTVEELETLFRGRDPRDFLNTRNEKYRAMKMKESPPSPGETIRLMAKEPNLIRRPLAVRGDRIVAGYDELALTRLIR